jgi:hypothetical protein
MCFIRKTFIGGSESGQNEAQHANFTIFLISVIFFICNGTFTVIFSLDHAKVFNFEHDPRIKLLLMTVKFTLPLLNAALFPMILILRKPSLRMEIKELLQQALSLPVAGYLRMKGRVCYRQGFWQLGGEEENQIEEVNGESFTH